LPKLWTWASCRNPVSWFRGSTHATIKNDLDGIQNCGIGRFREHRVLRQRRHSPPRPIADVRLDGGCLCLDFVNTIHDRYALEIEDYLQQPQRFLEWCVRAGALRPD